MVSCLTVKAWQGDSLWYLLSQKCMRDDVLDHARECPNCREIISSLLSEAQCRINPARSQPPTDVLTGLSPRGGFGGIGVTDGSWGSESAKQEPVEANHSRRSDFGPITVPSPFG